MMSDDPQSREQQRKQARAIKTAWVLGFIALAIFATFIGSAVMGH